MIAPLVNATIFRQCARGLALAVILTHSVVVGAQQQSVELWTGIWKRNLARSTFSPGPAPNTEQTITLSVVDGLLHVVEDGFSAQGGPTHAMYVVKFDGTEHIVDPGQGIARTYRWVDERSFEGLNIVKGEQTTTIEYTLARDGKTFTSTTTGITWQGQLVHNVAVYEKQ